MWSGDETIHTAILLPFKSPARNRVNTAIGKLTLNPNTTLIPADRIELTINTGLRPLASAMVPHTKLKEIKETRINKEHNRSQQIPTLIEIVLQKMPQQ